MSIIREMKYGCRFIAVLKSSQNTNNNGELFSVTHCIW